MNIQISRMSIVPIVVQQVTQNNPPQAQVAPVYNNIQQNQPRPLTFAEQEMQRQKADALNKVNSYYSG
jgi:predicted XRE-type DNA-binding protein